MRRSPLVLSLVVLGACGAPRIETPKGPDNAPTIVRVERGLIPEVRIEGEQAGWSIAERLRVHHTPGVSIAVIQDYRVVWAKAYGVADVSTGAPLTETALMQAASVSKLFGAVAALKAVDAGKLTIDGNINQSLRSWHLPENDLTRATPVTLKHLLSHSAGTNVRSFLGYYVGEPLPTTAQVLEGEAPAKTGPVRVDAAPGTKFRYSGGGTTIVEQALVDAEGRPYATIMRDAIFAPLGLSRSTFDTAPAHPIAAGHDYDAGLLPDKHRNHAELAAAALWSTPSDIARLLAELQRALEGRSTIFSKELATRLTTPVIAVSEDDTISVGMGAFVERHGGGVYFGHDGFNDGFLTIARASKTKGYGAVVMVNGLGGTPLLLEIMRSIAAAYGWEGWLSPPITLARVDPTRLAALAGRYGTGSDGSIVVGVRGDRLEAREPFSEPLELLPISASELVSRSDGARFTFRRNPAGVDECVRAGAPWPPSGAPKVLARLRADATPPLYLLESGRFDEAVAAYKEILASNAADPAVAVSRFASLGAELLDQRVDPARALVVFRLNAALHPESARAIADLAEGLFRAGHRAEAALLYPKAEVLLARETTLGEFERLYIRWRLQKVKRRGILDAR